MKDWLDNRIAGPMCDGERTRPGQCWFFEGRLSMGNLTTELLARACQIFMTIAYPAGLDSVPVKKKPYFDISLDRPVTDYLPPAPLAEGVCEALPAPGGGIRGYAFRLGSAHFPHLKLKMQLVDYDNASWVCMVDTHDAFSRSSFHPPAEHPDAKAWRDMQRLNRQLKERIEGQLEREGLETFNSLLRKDLERWKAPVT